tara:strand:+ start:714 stop:1379 length:666 start_codon:yes stop_codon:yes gene_type:complete
MGGPSGGQGGGRTDAGPNRTTATKIGVGNINEKGKKTRSYKSDNPDAFRNRGAEKIKKGVKTPSLIINAGAAILSKPLQAGSKVTRDFYTDKVLGSKNFKGQTKTEFLSMSATDQEKQYKDYIDNRTSGRTDAYGNDISRDGRTGENKKSIEQPKVASQMDNTEVKSDLITADKTAPTEVEMTQDEINVANKRGKKTKTILTSVSGDNSRTTLSKKVLLGV